MIKKEMPKIIVIAGPTASGKTAWGISLAKKFNGEIISVDSRQIYQEMNIGTAKIEGKKKKDEKGKIFIEAEGIRHYGIDLVKPDKIYSVAEFQQYGLEIIKEILERKKLPFLVGGTGFYLQAIVENLNLPRLAPDIKKRQAMEQKTIVELVELLKKTDPVSAEKIDLKNKRRVVRALEVAEASGNSFVGSWSQGKKIYDSLQLGIIQSREVLYQRIDNRVEEQIKAGLVEETKELIKHWNDWRLPSLTGIGYKEIGMYLRGEVDLEKAKELIKFRTHDYARRQITWFKKNKDLRWVKSEVEAEKIIKKFLENR